MTPKYNLKDLHAACIKWAENPVFPFHWQQNFEVYKSFEEYAIRGKHNSHLVRLSTELVPFHEESTIQFAHFIGLDVEAYRIKETYHTAVTRYLSTLEEGDTAWPDSLFIVYKSENSAWVKHPRHDSRVIVSMDTWGGDSPYWMTAYYQLRLDLNPDYQVEP